MSKYNWSVYQSATHCEGHSEPGTLALRVYLLERFPYAKNLGIYVCRDVVGGSSYSHHAEGRAYDNGVPVTSGGAARPELGNPIVELLGPHGKALGLDHLIYNRIIYSAISPDGRAYTGTHPHYDHHHIGMTRASAASLTYATIVSVLGPANSTPQGGDELLPLMDGDGLERGRPEKLEDVRHLQNLLGFAKADRDGKYGSGTAAAVAPFSGGDGKLVDGDTYSAILKASVTKGAKGDKGDKGDKGAKGDPGAPGAPGKDGKAATLTIKSDVTLP